jgi:hypothetical protein
MSITTDGFGSNVITTEGFGAFLGIPLTKKIGSFSFEIQILNRGFEEKSFIEFKNKT